MVSALVGLMNVIERPWPLTPPEQLDIGMPSLNGLEVARLLGTSVGAVKSTSNRALARLRSQLGPSAEVLTRSARRRRSEGER